MGYEFCQICHLLDVYFFKEGQLLHLSNVNRVAAAAEKRRRVLTVKPLHNDQAEEWCEVSWEPMDQIYDE